MAQRLYLLISAILMAIVSQSSLASFIALEDGISYKLTCCKLINSATGEVISRAPWALMVLAIFITLLLLFTLFLAFYQNYALQKRMSIFSMLVTVGFMLTYVGFYFYYKSRLDVLSADVTWWAVAVPIVVLILSFMAFSAISKKEASVIFGASSFRLRD